MSTVVCIAGLSFGDEGKGTISDAIVRKTGASLVCRYNGGAQAGHNVCTFDGKHHTFAQFGSGTFAGANTYLSRYMLVNPISFLKEMHALHDIGYKPTVYVDRESLVTTPFHIAANRIREMTRSGRHGSCGMGIGETMQDFLDEKESFFSGQVEDDPAAIKAKLGRIRDRKMDESAKFLEGHEMTDVLSREWSIFTNPRMVDRILGYYADFAGSVTVVDSDFLQRQLNKDQTIVFEGAQGVLLDQDFGFHPFTTWTDCTFGNAEKLLKGFDGPVTKIGVLRAYSTRHGNGPFPTEDACFNVCSETDHNKLGEWQGSFRSGAFDMVLARYALEVVGGVDGLAVTNLDRLDVMSSDFKVCTQYRYHHEEWATSLPVNRPVDLGFQEGLAAELQEDLAPVYEHVSERGASYASLLAERLEVPLAIISNGPTAEDKIFTERSLAVAV